MQMGGTKTMRLRIGSGFGIPVYLHWTFFLLPLWVAVSYPADSQFSLLATLTVVGLVFFCVVLHEFGHALMARHFGIGTHDVTLYPIGGVARLLRMSEKPVEEMLIAVAGPAVNVVIAILLFVPLFAALLLFDARTLMDNFAFQVAMGVAALNVSLVLFNLLPAFPMDGGRVLRALLALGLGFNQATRIAVRVGFVVALLIGVAGVALTQSFMLPIIATFVIFAGQQELLAVRMRERRQAEEEPLTVLPVRPAWPNSAPQTVPPLPPLICQPRIAVYTWDNHTGTWRKEPGSLT
jgi:Zn-dependent protease